MVFAAMVVIYSVRKLSRNSADQVLSLMCETGEKNLDSYFESIEHSVDLVSAYAETDLTGMDASDLQAHVDRVFTVYERAASQTPGVMTYFYRIDPDYSSEVPGFWYVESEHLGSAQLQITDITSYDTDDTSQITWFTIPKAEGTPVWLLPYLTLDSEDARVISYSCPIYQDGTFVGVIGIEIDYSMLAEQVDSITLYDSGYAFVTDRNGTLVYHPHIDVISLSEEEEPPVPSELTGDDTKVEYEFDGVLKVLERRTLTNGMMLNVCVPLSDVDGNWERLAVIIALISVVIIVVFILISMRVSGKITRPLVELTEAAEKINEGDYDVYMGEGGDDEVGVLTKAFRKLITNLKAYISNLNELNKNLAEDNLSLEAATIRDSLTGVKNRFALRRDYDRVIESDVHLMMLDIDDFKKVNDNYGHSVGDYLLKKVGDALLDHFGAEYSYRYGGDEFLVIIPGMNEEEFTDTLTDLEHQLEEIYLEDKRLPVYFSAGYVYGRTSQTDDLRLMLKQADDLLYKAKKQGKNAFIGDRYNREYAEKIVEE